MASEHSQRNTSAQELSTLRARLKENQRLLKAHAKKRLNQ